ncbi:MAG: flagellar basal-body MS-ring/collar protein FliF [Rhodospirillaceae bacterium]|nr:flagellar basal-body MS-ring/collar protein FliF [Rhodospirillaceae bacterium]
MNPFLQQMRNLGPARLAAMGGVAVGLVAFIIFFATRFSAPQMELLYGGLSSTDSRAIMGVLESGGVQYRTENDGADVMVPSDQVTRLRMQMAEQGLPSGGSVGYELFDSMDALGTTNFVQNVNLVRALEGELSRTIKAIEGIQNARVHLVMPQREMFTREVQEPTASVYIKMQSGRLAENQVSAVQHLIAAAVPKLRPSNISIVDERGTLLSRSYENDDQMMVVAQEEARTKLERRLAQSVISLVESSLGPGKVRAEVRAEMDFDKVVTNQEIYNPDEQVQRSTVTVDENNTSLESDQQNVTVAQNLPDANLNNQGGPRSQTSERRTEETVNFEISKKTINQVRDQGTLKRLSVAVLVDGTYTTDEAGAKTYAPLPQETVEKIEALAQTAIGYDAARGDQIEVINMPFTGFDDLIGEDQEFNLLGFSKDEIMRMAEGLGVAIVAVLVILLVVRPLVTRAFETMPQGEDQLMSSEGLPQLTGPGGVPMPVPGGAEEEEDLDELIDIDKVEGRVKASSLRKISDIVDKHPEEALSIIRTWLYQES